MEISHEAEGFENRFSDVVVLIKNTIRQRWLTLVLVSAAVLALCIVGIELITPTYESVARVQIDPTRNPLTNGTNDLAAANALTPEAIDTEVSLLGSPEIARTVAERLNLLADPKIQQALAKSKTPLVTPDQRLNAVATMLLKGLVVGREKLTYILAVKYSSPDATQSAQVANAFADTYVETKAGGKAGTAERQAEWFQQRLAALGKEASEADGRAAQYRAQAGITQDAQGNNTGSIVDQQIGPLSVSLATAQADAAAARAKLASAEQQMAAGGIDSVSEVLASPVVSDLRRQRADVQRAVEEVQVRYGEKHPESIRVQDQLKAIDQQIHEEATRIVNSLRAAASAANASVASLQGSMSHLQAEQAGDTRAAVMADSLTREAAAKRAAYDRMSQLSMTSTEGAKNLISQAEIVERAHPLSKPTAPNKPLLMALAVIVAAAVGGATIAIQELMTVGMRSVDDVQTKLGLPVLAAVPKLPKSVSPADLLLDRPTSLYAESLRIARAAILGVRSGPQRKIIAITSALPSEGKTTTALAFARTLAINNAKTLLVECDVRRAQMRFLVQHPPTGPGLVEVLHGEASVEQAITPGDLPKLDHLLVTAPYFSSEDLFGGGNMERLLAHLRGQYEQIVLDLPPLVGLADGRFLSVLADATALIIKWNATPADAAVSALDWLKADGANPVGVIFSMVDSAAEGLSGLYYSKKYSAYYQAA